MNPPTQAFKPFSHDDPSLLTEPPRGGLGAPFGDGGVIAAGGVSCLETKSDTEGFGGWGPPGRGEPYSDCGQRRFRGCLNLTSHPAGLKGRPPGRAYVEVYHKSCFRASCPICHGDWERREADRAVHRLRSFKTKHKPIHVIVSVPRKDWGLSLVKLRPTAYKLSQEAGFWGGCSVFHKTRRGRFGPHFHMLGYGWITKTPEIYRRTKWLVKNKGIRDSLGKTLRYELSHAAIREGFHTVTWFGALAYCKFKAQPLEVERSLCPMCGQELVKLLWIGELGAPEPPGEIGCYYVDPQGWSAQLGWTG